MKIVKTVFKVELSKDDEFANIIKSLGVEIEGVFWTKEKEKEYTHIVHDTYVCREIQAVLIKFNAQPYQMVTGTIGQVDMVNPEDDLA